MRLLAVLGALQATNVALASGTYPPAPPRLGTEVVRNIDPEAYNLGKSIFTGRANLAALPPADSDHAAANAARLNAVVERIPARARTQLDVAALSRHLDSAGLEALLYYLELRFRLTEGVS